MLCSRCKKRMAVVFVSRMDGTETKNEGLCLKCARELGIKPVNDMMDQLGVTDEDLEDMSNQLMELMPQDGEDLPEGEEGFELGGAQTFPFLQNLFGGNSASAASDAKTEGNKQEKDKAKKSKKRKFLENYCTNLTQRARDGKIDNIVGRDKEIYRVVQILSRRTKNNPCLIGEPGVGKTAIAEGIALRIAQ